VPRLLIHLYTNSTISTTMKKTARKQASKKNNSKTNTKQKLSKWKSNLLAIAIVIVLTAFVFYGIFTFYNSPQYNNYCEDKSPRLIQTHESCEEEEGEWIEYPNPRINGELQNGYCDTYSKCSEEYNLDNNIYKKNVFMIAVIIGLIVLVGGLFISNRSVSGGLMGGGILTLIIGILQYWSELGDALRFITLGVVLAILIFIGIKKLR